MRVTLHIERLVLEGLPVDPADRARLVGAVETELARRLALAPPRAGRAVDLVRPGAVDLTDRPGPDVVGTRIGAALAEGIGP